MLQHRAVYPTGYYKKHLVLQENLYEARKTLNCQGKVPHSKLNVFSSKHRAPSPQLVLTGEVVTSAIYLTNFSAFLGTASCLAIASLFYMCSQLAQPVFEGWDFQPEHCLKFGVWRWLSKRSIPHDFRSQQWSEAELCMLAVPEEIQSKQSKQARPCWDQQRETGSVFYSALTMWPFGYIKERQCGRERERRLGCFFLSHEKPSTVLSPSLNVFKFLIRLVLSNCLMRWRNLLFSRHSCITDSTVQGPKSYQSSQIPI